jgi:hypothetical protein
MGDLPTEILFIIVHIARDESFFAAIMLRRACRVFATWITEEMTNLQPDIKKELVEKWDHFKRLNLLPSIDSALTFAARLRINQWKERRGSYGGPRLNHDPEMKIWALFRWESVLSDGNVLAQISVADNGIIVVVISTNHFNDLYFCKDTLTCSVDTIAQFNIFHAIAAFVENPEIKTRLKIAEFAVGTRKMTEKVILCSV